MSVNMSMIPKQFANALSKDTQELHKLQGQDLIHKSAYHVHKQKEEFKSYIQPYSGKGEFAKDFFYTPYKAWIKAGYGLYTLAKAPGSKEPGMQALYGATLITRSFIQIETVVIRALSRGLATLYAYLTGAQPVDKTAKTPVVGSVEDTVLNILPLSAIHKAVSAAVDGKLPKKEVIQEEVAIELLSNNSSLLFAQSPVLPTLTSHAGACPFEYMNNENGESIDFSEVRLD